MTSYYQSLLRHLSPCKLRESLGGFPSLTAVFVIFAGLTGAIFGP